MLREDIQNLRNATPDDLRKFGFVVGTVFCLLALAFFIPKFRKEWFWWFLIPGIPLEILAIAYPRALKWAYVGWMTLAMLMGAVVSTVLLTLLFYFVVTPIGLVARFSRRDFMNRKLESSAPTYWLKRPDIQRKPSTAHERQF